MPRQIEYEDLALAIELDGDGRYRIRTLSSPYGLPAAEPFSFPFRREELEAMLQGVAAGLLHGARRDLAGAGPEVEPSWSFPETGARLFRALFQGAVYETYLRSTGRTEAVVDRGLRIRVVLPAGTPDAGLLHALPWELLYCEERRDFLARSVLTPVIRQIALAGVSSPLPESKLPKVRILIAVANPRGLDILDEADERDRIHQAWCRQEGTEVDLLPAATLRGLSEALRSSHYQVVHFITHGNFDPASGTGSLVLVTSSGEADFVSSDVLAETLRANRELRLVFLNSCKSAQIGTHPGQDPMLGTAASLVRRGIPAVLAMQLAISDPAAKAFSAAVYLALARGSSLDAAVSDGRLALFQAQPESWEWITPVLFAGLSDAAVFRPLCSLAEDRTARFEQAVVEAGKLLGARSYVQAQRVVEARLEQGANLADLHYYHALALLAGRRPRYLKLEEIRAIEASARQVLGLGDCAAHHLCLLAFLCRDFYLDNFLMPPSPSYEELLSRAAAAPLDQSRMDELVRLVPWASRVVELVSERKRSDQR